MKRHNHKPVKNIRELKKEFREISSWVSGDTRFMVKALLFMATQQDKALKKKESDASVYIKYMMRFQKARFIDALNSWKEWEERLKECPKR